MYSNIVLNIFNNPKNGGRISKPDGIASCYNQDNTAHVEFSLRINSGVITECKFRAQANPYIIAVCSTMTNMIKGKMVSMLFLDPYSIKKELGDETDIDIMFCIDCVKLAVEDYKEKLEKTVREGKRGRKKKKPDNITEENLIKEESDEEFIEETLIDDMDIPEPSTEGVTETQDNAEELDDGFDDDDFDFSDFFEDEGI